MQKLAGSDADIEINGVHRPDEIGRMARALVAFAPMRLS